jgi:DnaJ-class molecular chaperone
MGGQAAHGLSPRLRSAIVRCMDPAQLKERIAQIFRDLDAYSYYELLRVAPEATVDEIRGAFHRMAMTMHPDRYQNYGDDELREQLYAIYKRVTEGYRVLTNHATRREYDEALGRGELRLQQTERKRSGPKPAADDIPPAARKFFLLAEDAARRGDKKTARLNYKFALNLAADHPLILERLAAVEGDG